MVPPICVIVLTKREFWDTFPPVLSKLNIKEIYMSAMADEEVIMHANQVNMEGFWRAAEMPMEIAIGVIVTTIAIYCLCRFLLLPKLELSDEEKGDRTGTLNIVAGSVIVFTLLMLTWSLVSLSTNRLPRKELDRSEIYKQMESNTVKSDEKEGK